MEDVSKKERTEEEPKGRGRGRSKGEEKRGYIENIKRRWKERSGSGAKGYGRLGVDMKRGGEGKGEEWEGGYGKRGKTCNAREEK